MLISKEQLLAMLQTAYQEGLDDTHSYFNNHGKNRIYPDWNTSALKKRCRRKSRRIYY